MEYNKEIEDYNKQVDSGNNEEQIEVMIQDYKENNLWEVLVGIEAVQITHSKTGKTCYKIFRKL